MNRNSIEEFYAYDDLLLKPKHSNISSRSMVSLDVNLGEFAFKHPVIPANMQTVTGEKMASAVIKSGGLAMLHRFMPLEEQISIVKRFVEHGHAGNICVSIGVKENDKHAISSFYEVGIRIFCIDVAHGDSKACIDMIQWMNKKFSNTHIIAGNVATGDGAFRLWDAGANTCKVGIGSGSICSTRVETGCGVPQLSALMEVYNYRKSYGFDDNKHPFIADGGIRNVGDIVKALCFADMVMVGNMFAGAVETPGNVLNMGGRKVKEYVGSSTHKTRHVEGVAALVEPKGTFEEILLKITDGLTSGCSYQGAKNLMELKTNPRFVKITSAGRNESYPHDVILK